MNKSDYRYIENRLNEMAKDIITIIYDKKNSLSFYNGNEIEVDNIIFKIHGYGSYKLSFSRKNVSYSFVINYLYNKYLEVVKNGK